MSKNVTDDRRHKIPDADASKFEKFVRSFGGPVALAKEMGISHVTVGTWLARTASPSLPLAAKIIELSNGELTASDIVEGTRPW